MVPSHTSWSTPAAWYPAGHAAREVEEDQQGGVQHYHGQGDRAAYLAHAVVEGNAPGTIVLPTGRVDGMPWTHRAGKEGSDLGEGSKARTRRRKAPYTTLPGERWTHREAGKGPMLALHEVGGRCLPADAWKATMEGITGISALAWSLSWCKGRATLRSLAFISCAPAILATCLLHHLGLSRHVPDAAGAPSFWPITC